jgi:hypothetical protein
MFFFGQFRPFLFSLDNRQIFIFFVFVVFMPILTSLWIDFFQVDFDKSKHLADSTIKQRALEREKIIKQEQEKEESERKRNELEEIKRAQERYFD